MRIIFTILTTPFICMLLILILFAGCTNPENNCINLNGTWKISLPATFI